ncbi:hypothetical protein V3Q77_14220 [Flavobacterium davisii]|nr:PTS system mannose/fructose/sorbose family transporter subunit IID [Flavobacterium columnare]
MLKKSTKLSLLYLISTIGADYWFFLIDDFEDFSFKNIIGVTIKFGLIGGLIPTLTVLTIGFLFKKIKPPISLAILLFVLMLIFTLLVYWYFITIFTYHLEHSK